MNTPAISHIEALRKRTSYPRPSDAAAAINYVRQLARGQWDDGRPVTLTERAAIIEAATLPMPKIRCPDCDTEGTALTTGRTCRTCDGAGYLPRPTTRS